MKLNKKYNAICEDQSLTSEQWLLSKLNDENAIIQLIDNALDQCKNRLYIKKIYDVIAVYRSTDPNIFVMYLSFLTEGSNVQDYIPFKAINVGNTFALSLNGIGIEGSFKSYGSSKKIGKLSKQYKTSEIWPKFHSAAAENSSLSIDKFELEPDPAKYFQYGQIQKQMLTDIVQYLKAGGDPFGNANVKFHRLKNADVGALSMYKNDPAHVNPNTLNKVITVLTEHYGQLCRKPLYRGVSKAEFDGILKQIRSGKTSFIRSKTTSFTTDYQHAEKFAQYGGGSIVDVGKKREAGAVLTVNCKKPLVYIDEWLFYFEMAFSIAGINNDMTQKQALEDTLLEHEWLLPKNYNWKVVDKDNLVFEIS